MSDSGPGADKPIPGFFSGTSMPTTGWWQSLWPDPANVVAQVGIRTGMTVVDLCCGDGWFTLPISRIASETTAIDIDPAMTASLRSKLVDVRTTRVLTADAYSVANLVPSPVDVVLLANAFHGVPDRRRLLSAIANALRPGGRLVVINWHRLPRAETVVDGVPRGPATDQRFTPEATIAEVAGREFSYVETLSLPPYHYAAIFQRQPA